MSFLRVQAAEAPGQSKAEKLRYLSDRVAVCRLCPEIAKQRQHTVFGTGNPNAQLMFVGEAPGRTEDALGTPFVGVAGDFLNALLHHLGVERSGVYIANVLCCRPDSVQGNRPPLRSEMFDCLPFLFAQIETVKPKVICALGSTAIDAFDIEEQISEAVGRLYYWRRIPVVPTWHPAYVLRNPTVEVRRGIWLDLCQAWILCGHGVTKAMEEWIPPV